MGSDSQGREVHPAIAGAVSEVRRAAGTLQIVDEPSRLIQALEKGAPPDRASTPPVCSAATDDWTLSSVVEAIRRRRLSATEVMQESLRRIERSSLHAFIHLDRDRALKTALRRDSELASGQAHGPLHGAPLAHKDLFYIEGMPTSCGTAIPDYFVAEQTATVVTRLADSGAITVGKLNMTELAMSPFGDNPRHGDVGNPWSVGACVGGSSSGSAAAVAAGLVLGALGSDTAGSIRMPAAYCGVVGLKPTYGRVSRAGAMPLSWSLDHVGPMARTVRDVALMLGVIAGHDQSDRTTSAMPVADYAAALDQPVPRVRLAVPTNYYWDALDADLEGAIRAAIDALVRLGVEAIDLELPHQNVINSVSSLMTRSEGTAIHGAFAKNNPEVLSPAINERLEIGRQVSAYDYLQAQRLRARLARDFIERVFGQVDMIIAPVVPGTAPRLADVKSGNTDAILAEMVRLTSLTRPANGLGLPAVGVPCGFSKAGLPFAFQLIGRPFDELSLLQVANRYEQSFEWWRRTPV